MAFRQGPRRLQQAFADLANEDVLVVRRALSVIAHHPSSTSQYIGQLSALLSHEHELVRRDAELAIQMVESSGAKREKLDRRTKAPGAQRRLADEAKRTIVESVSCASIASEFAEDCDVVRALRAGRYAGEHGKCIPPAPLLDLAIATRLSRSPQYLGRREGEYIPLWGEYDSWLDQFYWGQDPELSRGASGDTPYWSDMVAFAWPGGDPAAADAVCWAEAYNELLDDTATLTSVFSVWGQPELLARAGVRRLVHQPLIRPCFLARQKGRRRVMVSQKTVRAAHFAALAARNGKSSANLGIVRILSGILTRRTSGREPEVLFS